MVCRFWFMVVIPNAARKAWEALGVWGVLMELVVSFIADYLASGNIGLLTVCVWGVLLLVTIIYFVFKEPARLYEEMGGFVGQPIVLSPEPPPPEAMGGELDYERGINVKNITAFNVNDCMLRLMDATNVENGESILRISKEDLAWSNKEGLFNHQCVTKTIAGKNLSRICNVARWQQKSKSAIFTLCHSFQGKIPKGKYKLEIQISGQWERKPFNYIKEMLLAYNGKQILLGDEILEDGSKKSEKDEK